MTLRLNRIILCHDTPLLRSARAGLPSLWVSLWVLPWILLWASAPPISAEETVSSFATFGYKVTQGAAPGYVEDAACTICHRDLAKSYREVGMSQSFADPQTARSIEDFDTNPYFHEPSQRFFRMKRSDDGGLSFRRWQVDSEGKALNIFETDVDWILGSGHTSRVYLYRTPGGELYQLPLSWYSQGKGWGMAPGFDRADHGGIGRRVQRECMFCHNAYPDVPAGSDKAGQPHLFPEDLPQGTGCQRCHGPGAKHVAAAFAGEMDEKKLHASIVNPAKLSPERRNDICYGCHLQPTVALMGVRRFDRPDYSFRPGEALSDYMVLMDMQAEAEDRGDRFEINHHPYRLEQSRCFLESAGQLSCLSCHDPHRKVPPADRAEHYRSACMSCHENTQLSELAHNKPLQTMDCVSCHMPRRRTRDVVHVVMTDHKIQRHSGGPKLTAPREESDPILIDMDFHRPKSAPTGALGEAYRAIAVLRAGGRIDALNHLEKQLDQLELDEPAPLLALTRARLQNGRIHDAEVSASNLYASTQEPLALEWWALAKAQRQRFGDAESLLRKALESQPDRPELHFNLALILLQRQPIDPGSAIKHLHRALELRPNMGVAWFHLGNALCSVDRNQEALAAYRQALAVDPSHGKSYLALADLLQAQGQTQQAVRWLRHGQSNALDPQPVAKRLAEITANERSP